MAFFKTAIKVIRRIRDSIHNTDFSIQTWLLLGASLQTLLLLCLPRNFALLLPISVLLCRFLQLQLRVAGIFPNPEAEEVIYDRITAQYPDSVEKADKGIVVLVLAASMSHPNGGFVEGMDKLGKYFESMWQDANTHRERYGYLGNTPSLTAELSANDEYGPRRGDDKGKTMMWLSYWKTLDGLHAFANEGSHLQGMVWWEKVVDKYKFTGLMHEVYEVPAGNWENVSANFRPFGLTNARFPVETEKDGQKVTEWVPGVRSMTKGRGTMNKNVEKEWKNMTVRMGRPNGSVGLRKRTAA
ncbi:hypothetical protein BDV96DRAFT_617097 [Lophiotrema nucula]|uniref:Uncharacterized protein n=1 Tax=Lophiotrema nucula TaxID=690887 RepID=A0A6A5YL48_9PLEO|nr:hypothetical protein BDV96DRAFT_617097 [Lophiotrema nucula]